MIVAVGTKNPAKVKGVRLAFSRYFTNVILHPVDSSPVARAQPLGLRQMSEGAVARAKFALSRAGGDFGVGVEAGIFKVWRLYFDHQQAAVVDGTGRVSLGHSAGYPLPHLAIDRMIEEGKELEEFAKELSGIDRIGDKGGLIHYLTKGKMSRASLTEQCVVMALIPWLNRDIYDL